MTGRHIIACVLAFLVIAAPLSSALAAEPVLYTIKFAASGTVDGVPFTDEPLVFPGVTDTDTVAALAVAAPPQLTQLIQDLALAAGVGLIIVSIFKIKAWHNNPPQTVLGLPVFLAASLVLPAVRDGALVTLTIDSILNNTVEFSTRRVAGGL